MEIILHDENFESEVLKSDLPVIVDFWAGWCVPCKIIAPVLSEIALEYKDSLKVGKLNVDENPDLAQTYQIRSIPNLKIFKGGKIVGEIFGAMPKTEILKAIQKHV